ncbi:VOC family protein, partial [Streptococcus pneumoniae]|uniref:VOC family protein n=1 Tax=Streptococcus pneumoniae TaxID=1313 RepID=UPI000A91F4DC
MNLNQLDIIVSNVPQVCADLEHILDKKADYANDGFAQFTIGSHCLMLSQNHLVPLENFQSGIIIHIEVEDVDQNYKRLNELGIKVLHGPTVTPNHSYLSQLDVTYKTPDLMSHFLPPHEVSF